jgi:alkyl hydroperoxide reductase subunit F
VDIMNLQLAEKLIPAAEPGGLIEVKLANGGSLKGKTVILSTGARWRNVNVPGEAEYRTKAWPTARTAMARCSRARTWR